MIKKWWCVCTWACMHMCTCMHACNLACACICGSHRSTSSIYLYLLHISFWDKVYHWNSNFPFLLDCLASEPLVSSCLSSRPPLNLSSLLSADSIDILVWLCFMWVLGSKNQVFVLCQHAVYALKHCLNPKSMQTLVWLSSLNFCTLVAGMFNFSFAVVLHFVLRWLNHNRWQKYRADREWWSIFLSQR